MKKVAIVGAGDLGQLIGHHLPACGEYTAAGFFDDYAVPGTRVKNIPVLGPLSMVADSFSSGQFDEIMIGIGYNHMKFRKAIFESLHGKIPFATLIHSSSYVDHSATLGSGCFILPGCTVDAHAKLGNNVLLNTGGVVAHDTSIGSHSFLAPSVAVAGKTQIGECCILGINCTIIDNLTLGNFIRIAAGAVVVKNLELSGMYAGVPAQLKTLY